MLSPIFKNWFEFCYYVHHYSRYSLENVNIFKKNFSINNFGKFSVTISAIDSQNKMQG